MTVNFDGDITHHEQGIALLDFERILRKQTGKDCRVYKQRMGDDSKLRVMMTQKQRDKL